MCFYDTKERSRKRNILDTVAKNFLSQIKTKIAMISDPDLREPDLWENHDLRNKRLQYTDQTFSKFSSRTMLCGTQEINFRDLNSNIRENILNLSIKFALLVAECEVGWTLDTSWNKIKFNSDTSTNNWILF